MPPDAGRLGVAARVLGPFTESSPSEQFHGWFVAAGVAVTVAIGLLAWPELATIGDAILYLAP
jgi:hypothetical protein